MTDAEKARIEERLKNISLVSKGSWAAVAVVAAWLLASHHFTVEAAESVVEKTSVQLHRDLEEIKDALKQDRQGAKQRSEKFREYHDKLQDKIDRLTLILLQQRDPQD